MVFTITNPHLLLAVYDEIFSLRSSSTRKPGVFGLRVAKRIEKTDIKISASFMMLCLLSIGVYGNAG